MNFFKGRVQTEVEKAIEFVVNDVMNDSYYDARSIRNSDVYTAVKILAGDVASSKILSTNSVVESLLNTQANSLQTGFTLKHKIMFDLLIYGNAFVGVVRNDAGLPITLKTLDAQFMTVSYDEEEFDLIYDYLWNGDNFKLDKKDVLHFKIMSEDGLMGVSPLVSLQREISLQDHGNKVMLSFFKRGAFGSGILEAVGGRLDAATRKKIRAAWEESNSGESSVASVMITDSSLKYTPMPMDTKVLDLVDNNVYSTKQIAKVFGIPLSRFGMELVNSNDGDMSLEYVKSTLTPYFNSIEEELNMKLGFTHRFDYSHLLETSFKEQSETYVKLIEAGVLTPEEVKNKLFKGGLE